MSARPAVYGGQLVTNGTKFVGINLGFNFYREFEEGVNDLVQNINRTISLTSSYSVIDAIKIKKKIAKNQKAIKHFQNTPFGNGMLYPDVITFRRELIINNDSIKDKYKTFRTINGNYTLFCIGDYANKDTWHKRFGDRRKFTEEDLLYMNDYNYDIGRNTGYSLSSEPRQVDREQKQFAAVWGSYARYVMILLNKDLTPGNIIDDIENALHNGSLSIVSEEPRIFKNHGCCIVDCEEAYLGRRRN